MQHRASSTRSHGPVAAAPDPQRLGGIGWLERTGGQLTREQRAALLGPILRTHARHLRGIAKLLVGHRAPSSRSLPDPPDSRLARSAESACAAALPVVLVGHSVRTWYYGQLLADLDGHAVDPELSYVAALLHDVGLASVVAGEDFTLRGAALAREVMEEAGISASAIDAVRDAISVHTLPGADVERDGALGTYLQAGAMLDLVGLRACDVPSEVVRTISQRHPREGLVPVICPAVTGESRAMPDGRFAQINRWGFSIAIRAAVGNR